MLNPRSTHTKNKNKNNTNNKQNWNKQPTKKLKLKSKYAKIISKTKAWMREFLPWRRDYNTQREKERLRVLSIYIERGNIPKRKGFLFLFAFEFYFDTFFFFNTNPNVCLSNIAIYPYYNSHLLSSMAPGIHYYFNFNFFPCFSLSLPRFHLFPPFLSYHISFYFIF